MVAAQDEQPDAVMPMNVAVTEMMGWLRTLVEVGELIWNEKLTRAQRESASQSADQFIDSPAVSRPSPGQNGCRLSCLPFGHLPPTLDDLGSPYACRRSGTGAVLVAGAALLASRLRSHASTADSRKRRYRPSRTCGMRPARACAQTH